ncbi:MAG: hypothetical protein H0W64_04660 [Gammaproteobacteria bacterium]|nr:hypothetical protein [Gammaproteobacteria bacterium]
MPLINYVPGKVEQASAEHQWFLHIHIDPFYLSQAKPILEKSFKNYNWDILQLPSQNSLFDKRKLDGAYTGEQVDQRFQAVRILLKSNESSASINFLKHCLLECWHKLQSAGIPLYYQTPPGDRALTMGESELLTPFSYTAKLKDGYTFLQPAAEFNPNHLPNPLNFCFDPKSLSDYQIEYDLFKILKATLRNLQLHTTHAQSQLDADFYSLNAFDTEIEKLHQFYNAFSKFYLSYCNDRQALEDNYKLQIDALHKANELVDTDAQRTEIAKSYVKLYQDREYALRKREKEFDDYCGKDNIDELAILSRIEGYQKDQMDSAFSMLRDKLNYSVEQLHSLFKSAPKEGIFTLRSQAFLDLIRSNVGLHQLIYNRQMHILIEQKQLLRLKCLLNIYQQMTQINLTTFNPFLCKQSATYKQVVLQQLVHKINAAAGTPQEFDKVINDWLQSASFAEKNHTEISNKKIISEHRNTFFNQRSDKPTSTENFVQELKKNYSGMTFS